MGAKSGPPPASGGTASKTKMLVGALVVVCLNYVFTELMDDSGLAVRIATCRFRGPLGNATARAVFRATAEYAGATMRDPSGSGALRFELMEHKTADDSGDFSALTVHWHQPPEADPGLPGWLAAEVDVRSAQRLRTVFPERSRWKEAVPIAEPGELGEVGRIALLVQRSVLVAADADAADQLRRGWADLGYNALGEPGVVRCDLFVYDDDPLTFVARKVFRGPQALRAHEGSDHFVRWREATQPLLSGSSQAAQTELLDTLHPRSSPYPFRTRWATAA